MDENSKHTVLFVDDEPMLLDGLAYGFKRMGFNVFTAEGGKDAFEIVKKNPNIDLVVSDVRMPEGDGLELLDRIRGANIYLPVVFITGFSDYIEAEIYHRGAEGLFSKPFGMKEMAEHVRKYLLPYEERWISKPDKAIDRQLSHKFDDLNQARNSKYFDLGRGGISLRISEESPGVGAIVGIKIEFSNGELQFIEGVGIVRWSRIDSDSKSTLIGIEFLFVTPEVSSQLIASIKELGTNAFIPIL